MNFRTYLELETRLSRKLMQDWHSQSAKLYSQIADEVSKGDFDAARALVKEISLYSVGEANREWIRAMLGSMATWGSYSVAIEPKFSVAGANSKTLDKVTDLTIAYLKNNGTKQLRDSVLQSIAQAEEDSKTQKMEVVQKDSMPRYVKPLVDFSDSGDDQLKLISSLNASRMASWGFLGECDVRGADEYTLDNPMDNRTSDFCRMMVSRNLTFSVDDGQDLVNKALSTEDPKDLATVQPWPSTSKDAIADYSAMSEADLTSEGLQIPPYHPGCRTHLVLKSKGNEVTEGNEGPSEDTLQPYTTDEGTFSELGEDVSQSDIDKWNSQIGVNPVDALSELSGKDAPDLLEDLDSFSIDFQTNGDVSLSTELADEAGDAGVSFDTLTGRLYLDKLDLSDDTGAIDTLKDTLSGLLTLGSSSEADTLVVQATEDSAIAYGKMGFTPTALDWQTIRLDAQDLLSGDLNFDFRALSVADQSVVMSLLGSQDESSFSLLCNLDIEINGQNLADALFGSVKGQFLLDLTNKDATGLAQSYLED